MSSKQIVKKFIHLGLCLLHEDSNENAQALERFARRWLGESERTAVLIAIENLMQGDSLFLLQLMYRFCDRLG